MRAQLSFHQLTTAGDRDVNQDCMAHKIGDDYALFVVADGLGGHHAGEKASQYFCRALIMMSTQYQPAVPADPYRGLMIWINAAIDQMRRFFGDDPAAYNAHTTCAILYLDDERVLTAHCGDSRIYRLNRNQLVWRTKDHSATQNLVDQGIITEREMGAHPEQNQLKRSINVISPSAIDVHDYPAIASGETFLLCSDGFWENIKEAELLMLAQPDSGKEELKKLAKLTVLRAQGKSDNVTVQWIRCT